MKCRSGRRSRSRSSAFTRKRLVERDVTATRTARVHHRFLMRRRRPRLPPEFQWSRASREKLEHEADAKSDVASILHVLDGSGKQAADRGVGWLEVWVVEHIEELEAHLEISVLIERCLEVVVFKQRGISLPEAGLPQHVPAAVAECVRRGKGERARVEPAIGSPLVRGQDSVANPVRS